MYFCTILVSTLTPTTAERAASAIHVEIALDFDVDPDDPDSELFGPGGWRLDGPFELHINGQVLHPEVVAWRRERVNAAQREPLTPA